MIDPEKYETNKSVAARDAAEFVPKLIEVIGEWKPEENILDYGCGAGSTGYNLILPQVEKCDSKMYSVDISEKMIEFAREKYPHPRITYEKGDILNDFPFPDVQFDKAFAIYVFHFVPDMTEVFKKFLEILKPGGRLGFTVVSKSFYLSAIKVLGHSENWKKYIQGYEKYFPTWLTYDEGKGHETLTRTFKQAGFTIVHLDVQKRTFPFDNIEVFLDLYMSLIPMIDTIPDDLQPLLREDLRKLLTEYAGIPLNGKEIISKYECVVAVIEKPNCITTEGKD